MIKRKLLLTLLLLTLTVSLFSTVKADTVTTTTTFGIDILTGGAFMYQEVSRSMNFTFTVTDGNLTGTGSLNTDSTHGTLSLLPTSTGVLTLTATNTNYTLTVNGVTMIGNVINFVTAVTVVITWTYDTIINPDYPGILNVRPFWQWLFEGNLLGFFGAIFTWAFVLQDILVGALCALFLVPIYLRTKSLLLLAIIWVMLGGFFITLMPALSGLAIIFLALGIGSILYKMMSRD